MEYRLSDHARLEAENRSISIKTVDKVMLSPEQILSEHSHRKVYQSRIDMDGKLYLVRVIVEMSDPLTVVTVYRTSKIKKYWSSES